jgi:hypothetical protein
MILQPGDQFAVRTGGFIADAIIAVEHIYSEDHEACKNHAGIILDEKGNTFEALQKIGMYNLSAYKGCEIIIARHINMTDERFQAGLKAVAKYEGRAYPWWRLGLYLFGFADNLHRIDRPVCSELNGKFEMGASLRQHCWGLTPDNLVDEWRSSTYYQIIYEGVWQ